MSTELPDAEQWLPLAQAAERLGTTPLNVLMHIKRGLLLGEEVDGGWQVDSASLAALVRKRTTGEVPGVCQSGCSINAGGCGECRGEALPRPGDRSGRPYECP